MSVWEELKRRSVVRVGLAYLAGSWLLLQIADLVLSNFEAPPWIVQALIAAVALGFPCALLLAWHYEITPQGIKAAADAEPIETIRFTGRKIDLLIIGLLVLAVAVLWVDRDVALEPADDLLPNSIAVLPFANLSPNPDDAYFALSIHQQLLNELATIRDIRPIARTSVLQYANNPPPIQQISEELNVETVMEGSVRYDGDRINVSASLVDGVSGIPLWTEQYDGDLSDIFSIQKEISVAISRALEARLRPVELERLEMQPTSSTVAYALFLEASNVAATDALYSGNEAIEIVDRALEIDPEFALAHGFKAVQLTWTLVNAGAAAIGSPDEAEAMIQEHASRALDLDEGVAYAWLARAVLAQISWRWLEADQAYERALELSPNDEFVLRYYSQHKSYLGDHPAALNAAERLVRLSPNDIAAHYILSNADNYAGRLGEALNSAQRALEYAPGVPFFHLYVGHVLRTMGEHTEAETYYRTGEELIDLNVDANFIFLPGLAAGYGLVGLDDDARRVFARYQSVVDPQTVGAGDWAMAYIAIGDTEMAYQWLSRASNSVARGVIDPGFFAVVTILRNNMAAPMLEQAEFRNLRERTLGIATSR